MSKISTDRKFVIVCLVLLIALFAWGIPDLVRIGWEGSSELIAILALACVTCATITGMIALWLRNEDWE